MSFTIEGDRKVSFWYDVGMSELSEPHEWHPDTILAKERGILDYVSGLELYLDDFEGTILDLGSGAEQLLNQNIQNIMAANPQLDLHPDIVSVSPDMVSEVIRQRLKESTGYENKTVAAIGQQLPFRDGSFDRVVSLGGVVNYAGFEQGGNASPEVIKAWMQEVVRVLKPGGEARLGMIYGEKHHQAYIAAFDALKLDGDIAIEQAKDDNDEPYMTTTHPPEYAYRMVIRKRAS